MQSNLNRAPPVAGNGMATQPELSNLVISGLNSSLEAYIRDRQMKKTYEKPTLRRRGRLTARTAQIVVSGVTVIR